MNAVRSASLSGSLLMTCALGSLLAVTPAQVQLPNGWTAVHEDPQDPQSPLIAIIDEDTGTWWSDAAPLTFPNLGSHPNWYQAIEYAANLTTGGFTDWRVPAKDEILKAYENGACVALETAFPPTEWDIHPCISSTTQGQNRVWWVSFCTGNAAAVTKASTADALCSRGPVYSRRGRNKVMGGTTEPWTIGFPSPGCTNAPTLTTRKVGNLQHAVLADDAPSQAPGVLLLSPFASEPLGLSSATLFVDPLVSTPVLLLSDIAGVARWQLAWPTQVGLSEVYLQVLWLDSSCGVRPVSASAAVGLPR